VDSKNVSHRTIQIIATLAGLTVIITWLVAVRIARSFFKTEDMGIPFDAVNALFSGLALVCLIVTLQMQRKELSLQRMELRRSSQQLKRQAESAERTNEIQLFLRLVDMMDQIRTERGLIEECAIKSIPSDDSFFDDQKRSSFDRVARVYDNIAYMLSQKMLPMKFIDGFYSRPITVAWGFLEVSILTMRQRRSQPSHMRSFQMLAVCTRQMRRLRYPDEKQFSVSADLESQAKEWYRDIVGDVEAKRLWGID
jgi:hypothetical protein